MMNKLLIIALCTLPAAGCNEGDKYDALATCRKAVGVEKGIPWNFSKCMYDRVYELTANMDLGNDAGSWRQRTIADQIMFYVEWIKYHVLTDR